MVNSTKDRKASVKDAIKSGVRPKKTTTKKAAALKEIGASNEVAATLAPAKESPVQKAIKAVKSAKAAAPTNKVQDVASTLPESKQKVYIKAKEAGDTKVIKVDIETITATSQTVYVADIHAQNAQVLATVYWLIMPNTQHVVLRVTKEEYDALMARPQARSMNHLYSVVDNAVFPSLTYGSWKLKDIKDFPTLEQIDEYDAKFRTLEVYFHNRPVIGELYDDQEDEGEFDFTAEDEDEDDAGEDEFDFS